MDRRLCVFVVDDRPMIAYALSAALRDHGYVVIPYIDPLSALRDVERFIPDVLIRDIEKPDLGGVDLAIQVQTRCPDCKVFLMSGYTGRIEELERARENGFRFQFFAKPVSAQTFARQIESLSGTNPYRQVATT